MTNFLDSDLPVEFSTAFMSVAMHINNVRFNLTDDLQKLQIRCSFQVSPESLQCYAHVEVQKGNERQSNIERITLDTLQNAFSFDMNICDAVDMLGESDIREHILPIAYETQREATRLAEILSIFKDVHSVSLRGEVLTSRSRQNRLLRLSTKSLNISPITNNELLSIEHCC